LTAFGAAPSIVRTLRRADLGKKTKARDAAERVSRARNGEGNT
jgi:hypothetical protein